MKRINSEEMVIALICLSLFAKTNARWVGTPTGATVCDGTTATLTCDIRKSGNLSPTWRIFASADTSGQPVASLNSDENSPPYNYPEVQAGDTVARLEVMASLSIDGYHFQCRLPLFTPVDSPKLGNITVITGVPSCPSSVVAVVRDDNDAITVTWQQPLNTPPVTSTTVTYCPTSSPNCGNSMNCTSPCTISGLDPGTEYQFTVIPTNICGSPTGCTGNTTTTEIAATVSNQCPVCTSEPTATITMTPAAAIPSAVLLLSNIISVVVVFFITRHIYKRASQASSSSKRDDDYQVERPLPHHNIRMTNNPVYDSVRLHIAES